MRAGLTPRDIVRNPLNLVVGVDVGDVRSIALGVRDDPWPPDIDEPEHPRNGAHALITGLERLGTSERRRRQKELVVLPSITFVVGCSIWRRVAERPGRGSAIAFRNA